MVPVAVDLVNRATVVELTYHQPSLDTQRLRLKSTLEKIAAGHPQSRIHELLPWAFTPAPP